MPRAGGTAPAAVLAVSSHLDDAVMAVGATLAALAESGGEFSICTVFSGLPSGQLSEVATAFHEDCGLGSDAVSSRRSEDRAAVAVLGGRAIHLDFLDAIYRRQGDEWLCRTPRSMFADGLPAEPELQSAVAEALVSVIRQTRPAEVWAGAAVGEHVDHRLVRGAAEEAAGRAGVPLRLWEGLPHYLGSHRPAASQDPAVVVPTTEAHVERKLAAIAAYPSQLRMLWPSGDWASEFVQHAMRRTEEYGVHEILWPHIPMTNTIR